MSARTVTPAEAQALLDAATPGPWAVLRSDHRSIVQSALVDVAMVSVEDAPTAALLAAAPDLAATVASEPARLRAWQDAAADATTLRVRAVAERDAALAHAEELTRALTKADARRCSVDRCSGAWERIAEAHRVDPSPANAERIARLCECAAEVRDEAQATRDAALAHAAEFERALATLRTAVREYVQSGDACDRAADLAVPDADVHSRLFLRYSSARDRLRALVDEVTP